MSRLPPPTGIQSLRGVSLDQLVNESSHSGISGDEKNRVFAHERGQWPTHVYVDVINDCLSDLIHLISDLDMEGVHAMSETHISLIRGYHILRHHQIDAFVNMIKSQLELCSPFSLCLNKLNIFENEDQSRCFIAVCESRSCNSRKDSQMVVEKVESVLKEFNSSVMPMEYEDNILHVSVAWSLPKHRSHLEQLMTHIQRYLDEEEPILILIDRLEAKIGNLNKQFILKSSFS